jgi:hypothetical protein
MSFLTFSHLGAGDIFMYSKLYNALASARIAVEDPLALVRKLEHGDADSSGSTLRTVGIVLLVVLVVGALGLAVMSAATGAANSVNTTSFNFK